MLDAAVRMVPGVGKKFVIEPDEQRFEVERVQNSPSCRFLISEGVDEWR
jgi:hypothetical protein